MQIRPTILVIAAAVICLPGAAFADPCVDHVTNSLRDPMEVGDTLHSHMAGLTLSLSRDSLEETVARAVLAKQDLENIDTLGAFLPPDNAKMQKVLQSMHDAKQAQIDALMTRANHQRVAMENAIETFCAHADTDSPDEADRRAPEGLSPDAGSDTGPPPGGWGDPPRNGDSDDNGDAAAAVAGGVLLGAGMAGSGGGGHHGGGSRSSSGGGVGCHPHH